MSYFKGIGSKSRSFTGRKLPLIGLMENKKHTIFNEYTPGSGVGASSVAARRARKKRAYVVKCKPEVTTPIIKELEENEAFVVDDNVLTFTPEFETQLNAAPLDSTLDLGTTVNSQVDVQVFKNRIDNVIQELETNQDTTAEEVVEPTQLSFITVSVQNPLNTVVNENSDNTQTLQAILSSDNYEIRVSESSTTSQEIDTDKPNLQGTTLVKHSLINTGETNDNGNPIYDYLSEVIIFT